MTRICLYISNHSDQSHGFEEFNKSLALVSLSNSTICLLGDFNLPKIDSETKTPKPDCSHSAFYIHFMETFDDRLALVSQSNSTIFLLGDFNLPKIDSETKTPKPDCSHSAFYRDFLEAFDDCLLEQRMTSPTRGQNVLT